MKRIILIVCLLGGWILPAVAQYYYTLQQCLEEGLANNYLLRITRNEEQIRTTQPWPTPVICPRWT